MTEPGRRKPRAPKRMIAGDYPIDTGIATIVADPARDGGYTIEVNNVPSSYIVLGAPEVLNFDYMEWMAQLIGAARLPEPFTAVHLGAAGCAFPSFVQQRWPSRNVAVEYDAGVAKLVRRVFDPPVEIRVAEARAFTHALAPGSVDVIVRDVFAGPHTPRPLTTVEFYRAAHRALTPKGLFLANIGDTAGLPTTREELAGLQEVFRHTAAVYASTGYGNVVVAASDAPLRIDVSVTTAPGHTLAAGVSPRRD